MVEVIAAAAGCCNNNNNRNCLCRVEPTEIAEWRKTELQKLCGALCRRWSGLRFPGANRQLAILMTQTFAVHARSKESAMKNLKPMFFATPRMSASPSTFPSNGNLIDEMVTALGIAEDLRAVMGLTDEFHGRSSPREHAT